MASTLVIYVRHGRTPTTGARLPGRAPGLRLSDKGRRQAEALAARLAEAAAGYPGKGVAAVYASPMERTRETAAPIARALGLPIHPMYFVVFVPIIGTISMFPFSINALGIREGGYVLLFAQIDRPDSEALALSLILYGITVLSSMPGGLLFALQAERKPMMVTQEQMPMDVITKDVP